MSVRARPAGEHPDRLGVLVHWAVATGYDALPPEALGAAKRYLLNTTAAILGGSGAPGADAVVRQVSDWGGRAESTIAVHGVRAPAPLAALANGVMAHALDFDDTQLGTGFHPNVSLVPALFSAAELAPQASGRDLLAAHVVALEVACRLTLAATNRARHPWLTTTLFGVLGAAFAAGRILGLDEGLLRHAIGIAYSSCGGNRQGLLDGTLIQRVQPGLIAQAAVAACCFARQGVTGALDALEGRYGIYPSYYGEDFDPEVLTQGLGRQFRMLDLALKPFPCCSYAQEPIEAALELAEMPGFSADAVAEARVWVETAHAAGLVDREYAPRSCAQVDAQFSMQYLIATALRARRLGPEALREAALADPATIALSRRVQVAVDPSRAGCVELRLANGTVRAARVPIARGDPRRPFSDAQLAAKLRDCAAQAATPIPSARVEALEQAITGIETMPRAADLPSLLA